MMALLCGGRCLVIGCVRRSLGQRLPHCAEGKPETGWLGSLLLCQVGAPNVVGRLYSARLAASPRSSFCLWHSSSVCVVVLWYEHHLG